MVPCSLHPPRWHTTAAAATAANAATVSKGIQGRHRAAAGTGAARDAVAAAAGTGAARDTAIATGTGASRDSAAATTGAICTDVLLAADHGGECRHQSRVVQAQHQEQATRVQGDLPRRQRKPGPSSSTSCSAVPVTWIVVSACKSLSVVIVPTCIPVSASRRTGW